MASKGKGRGKPQLENQNRNDTQAAGASVHDFEFWRGVAREAIPGEEDEWKVGEFGCIVQQVVTRLAEHWRKISQIADKTKEQSISISVPVKIVRADTPPEIFVGIKYSEKYGDGMTVKVPDPSQKELPLKVEKSGKGPTAEEVHEEATRGEKEKE